MNVYQLHNMLIPQLNGQKPQFGARTKVFFNTYLSHLNVMSNYISNWKDFLLLDTNILSQ